MESRVYLSTKKRPDGFKAMTFVMNHRGPDDQGLESVTVKGGVLELGHRRLSIRYLSAAGHQPMSHPGAGN